MAIWLNINSGASEPIYQQIVRQIEQAVASGDLAVGEKLPAVRKLAGELVVNPNTVAKAYMILEQQGLVETKTGAGTFVASPSQASVDVSQLNMIAQRFDNTIAGAINSGMKLADIQNLFESRLRKFEKSQRGGKNNE